jgi:preprotein translocase subunit SecF
MALCFARSTSVLALVTLLLATSLVAANGLNFAVEFTGGLIIQVHYPEVLASKSVQDTLVWAGLADASVTEMDGYPSHFFIILPPREDVISPQSTPHVVQQVIAALSAEHRHVEATSVEVITPRVGEELLLLGAAVLAAVPILACVAAIMVYAAVRYDWPVALSFTVTTIRNMVIILGLFLSAYAGFQWEFSPKSLTAMGCLAILVTGVGAVYASRAIRS